MRPALPPLRKNLLTTTTTGKTALQALRQSGLVRSDAHHPAHPVHHALLERTRGMAGTTHDPHRGRLAHRHRRAGTRAGARDGRNDRLG